MTPLRQRMIEDMELEQKPANTRRAYIRNVAALAKFFGKSPDQLDVEQIREYLLYLVREKKCSGSTYRQVLASHADYRCRCDSALAAIRLKYLAWSRRMRV